MQSQSMNFNDKASKLLYEYKLGRQNDDEIGNESHDYLMKFYKILGEYIAEETFIKLRELRLECRSEQEADAFDEDIHELQVHLAVGEYSGVSSTLSEKLEKINIVIEKIVFPNDDSLKYLGSESREILWRLGKIEFINCKFSSSSFRINNNTYFKKCKFKDSIFIKPFSINNFNDIYRYSNCTFEKEVYVIPSNENKEILCNLFKECIFLNKVTIRDLLFKKFLFKFPNPLNKLETQSSTNTKNNRNINIEEIRNCYNFGDLIIKNCIFENDLKLNGFSKDYLQKIRFFGYELQNPYLEIENLEIIDTKFEAKIEIKNTHIKNFKFTNSNVEKIFDTFQSKFIKAKFSKSIFSDFSGFEEVEFGLIDDKDDISFITIFEHVTFMDFSSFRSANFYSGLDFSKTNLKDSPNFLDVNIDFKNTKRETFRIAKKSFDDVGNNIEENKFFVEEMKAYRKELKDNGGSWFERFILFCNRWISNFGSSYIMPIGWLIVSILIFSEIIEWHSSFFNETENTYFWHSNFDYISIKANNFAKNFLPFSRFLTGKSGIEFVSLLFYIWFAVLIWQTIVAVKRHTQR